MNLRFWKHKDKKEVISSECLSKLPASHRSYYVETKEKPTHKVEDNSGDFVTSMIIGEVTGSALLGGAIGGDLLGGEIGSMMSDDNSSSSFDSSSDSSSASDFGGGDFGGGGSGSDW